MAVGVLCAVSGESETAIVRAVEDTRGRLNVVRRCADLAELLAAAEAGLGGLAVVSSDLELLDAESVDVLHRAGVQVVGVVERDRPWLAERLAACGVDLVVEAPDDELAARSLVEDALVVLDRGSPRPPEIRLPAGGRPDAPMPLPTERGRLVAVWGPTGAPGRTTVAVNVAAELAAGGSRTLLVDADTYGGSVAQVVGLLDEAPGLAAAARVGVQGALDLVGLARLAPVLAPDLRVLSGISRADRWPELSAPALEPVWRTARSLARWTVVDCGFCLEEDEALSYDTRAPRRNAATLSALEAADVVVVVGAADPVGVQRLVRGLGELSDHGLGAHRVVAVNRVRASVAGPRPAEAVADALARYAGVASPHLLPDDGQALDTALLSARTLREIAPGSALRRAIAALAAALDGVATAADPDDVATLARAGA
ncbi:AAA family ATPase [Cellulomonas alba]|uniref:Pilus biosynthesis protein CpaE n=1 Tax=Cellulomonas alba TaxID=3053467 RepID=A0ABT7SCR4_9CELL|nr:hypothetical protein [Cellulomonas alba]MDM7853977.1 hypothetical protein [Cellulomonas alba]